MLPAETCWGNLMSVIKAYNALGHLLVILHRKIQNARYELSRHILTFLNTCPITTEPMQTFSKTVQQFTLQTILRFPYSVSGDEIISWGL
jgi:hypothetical protein